MQTLIAFHELLESQEQIGQPLPTTLHVGDEGGNGAEGHREPDEYGYTHAEHSHRTGDGSPTSGGSRARRGGASAIPGLKSTVRRPQEHVAAGQWHGESQAREWWGEVESMTKGAS